MGALDWAILASYLAAMIALSAKLARGQASADDYYVGGRNLPWWAIGISTMATQTSANSFVSIPAFVALTAGGGLAWLQFELAVPIAMIVVMVLLIPLFRNLELVSVYEYLELRFDRSTRTFISALFLISRSLATGVTVYVSGLVLNVCLGIPVWACVFLIGVVTIIYDTLGGMAAVVYSDVIQMVVLLGGVVICVVVALVEIGGAGAALEALEPARLAGVNPGHGFGDGEEAPLWGFLVGGLFLYVSYYGVDQSQVQRELSAPTTADTKRSLVLNGLARFPLTLLYLGLGVAVGAVYAASPELRGAVPDDQLDQLIPRFILQYLPAGLIGILFAAIFSASMSSLDSALNSLSAATVRDFVEPFLNNDDPRAARTRLWIGKIATVAWGVAITLFALVVGNMADTVIEAINMIGSLFYGPILGAFLAGVLDRRARGPGVIAGVIAGIGVNLFLWQAAGPLLDLEVHWMWWNLTGVVGASAVTASVSRLLPVPPPAALDGTTLTLSAIPGRERGWLPTYVFLVLYFVGIFILAWRMDDILSSFL